MTRKQFIKEVMPFSDKVYRLSFRFLKDPELAKDMVQSIFCKLWVHRTKLNEVNSKEGYIIRMTKNACLDKIKLKKNKTQVLNHHKVTTPNYDSTEYVEVTKKVIETLPEKQKRIIQLRDIEGFSFDEISKLMELPLNNIRVSLSIARKKVRMEIQKIYNYGIQ